ncbi:dienelactone hydrolase family protein [Nocardioides sp. AX2bis]|uniref:dienelactone hydrolase family protein n=1 Tax=Nocardioides sp. AX2bis TaxID=2653157 RepID=UPI00135692E4|nr:dienelactone hydrolase family protein [Nocardioides sp. AX2bis]
MTEILMFHHAQGLTAGVSHLADRFRAAGHVVHTPDLYTGHVFEDLEEGLDHARSVGFGEVAARGLRAAADLGTRDLVVAGLSLGAMPAQELAQTSPSVRGALLLHGCIPRQEFGDGTWPAGVPVQVHGMDADPFFAGEDLDAARDLVAVADDAELFVYPGGEHLFSDDSLPSYDDAATALLTQRVLTLLRRVG